MPLSSTGITSNHVLQVKWLWYSTVTEMPAAAWPCKHSTSTDLTAHLACNSVALRLEIGDDGDGSLKSHGEVSPLCLPFAKKEALTAGGPSLLSAKRSTSLSKGRDFCTTCLAMHISASHAGSFGSTKGVAGASFSSVARALALQ